MRSKGVAQKQVPDFTLPSGKEIGLSEPERALPGSERPTLSASGRVKNVRRIGDSVFDPFLNTWDLPRSSRWGIPNHGNLEQGETRLQRVISDFKGQPARVQIVRSCEHRSRLLTKMIV